MRKLITPHLAFSEVQYKCGAKRPRRRKLYGSKNPNWKGGKIEIICRFCNKKFKVKPCRLKTKFCSVECYGKWQRINRRGKNHFQWKGGKVKKACLVCNKEFFIAPSRLKYGEGKFCSKRCYGLWQRIYRREENNSQWKGGLTNKHLLIRSSADYADWRKAVFERDNYICQKCGDNRGGNLRAHHIKSFSKYPEWRLKFNNGITLCEVCHRREHNEKNGESEFIAKRNLLPMWL